MLVHWLLSKAHISISFLLAFAFAMDHWSNIDTCIEILLGNLSFNTPRPVYRASIEILQEIVNEARSIQILPILEALDTSHCRWRDSYEEGPKQGEGTLQRNSIWERHCFAPQTSVILLTYFLCPFFLFSSNRFRWSSIPILPVRSCGGTAGDERRGIRTRADRSCDLGASGTAQEHERVAGSTAGRLVPPLLGARTLDLQAGRKPQPAQGY